MTAGIAAWALSALPQPAAVQKVEPTASLIVTSLPEADMSDTAGPTRIRC
jgi:hypothetical protein